MSTTPIPPAACDESRATVTIAVETVLTGLAFIAVIFRFISRLHARNGLMANDYAMFAAMLLSLADFGIQIAEAVDGLNRHILCISFPVLTSGLRNLFFSQILLFLALFFAKLSITLFVLKIGGLNKLFRTALVVNVTFLGLANVAFIINLLLQCQPIQGNWDPMARATADCVSLTAMMALCYVSAAVSIFTDFCLVFLPLPMIWNLQMSLRTKSSIIALMMMGMLAMICGIVRATQIYSTNQSDDVTWTTVPIGLCTMAELNIGIITGSLPACRALFLRVVAKARTRSSLGTSLGTEDTLERRWGGPGCSYLWHKLSRVGEIIGITKRLTGSVRLSDQPRDAAAPWRDAWKTESQDGNEKNTRNGGITKIITVELQHEDGDISMDAANW